MASSSSRKTLSDPAAVFPQESSDRLLDNDIARELRKAHQEFHQRIGEIDTPEEQAKHDKFHRVLEEKLRQSKTDSVVPPDRGVRPIGLVGQRIDVPGMASFCFVVGHRNLDSPLVLAPERTVRVDVALRADPDVLLGPQEFTILADAHDLAE